MSVVLTWIPDPERREVFLVNGSFSESIQIQWVWPVLTTLTTATPTTTLLRLVLHLIRGLSLVFTHLSFTWRFACLHLSLCRAGVTHQMIGRELIHQSQKHCNFSRKKVEKPKGQQPTPWSKYFTNHPQKGRLLRCSCQVQHLPPQPAMSLGRNREFMRSKGSQKKYQGSFFPPNFPWSSLVKAS